LFRTLSIPAPFKYYLAPSLNIELKFKFFFCIVPTCAEQDLADLD